MEKFNFNRTSPEISPERPKSVKEALLLAEKRSTSRGANDSVDNKLISQMD